MSRSILGPSLRRSCIRPPGRCDSAEGAEVSPLPGASCPPPFPKSPSFSGTPRQPGRGAPGKRAGQSVPPLRGCVAASVFSYAGPRETSHFPGHVADRHHSPWVLTVFQDLPLPAHRGARGRGQTPIEPALFRLCW